ncbi:alpha-crystallin A chain-like [Saccostrea echinata]|uniref:alpha-crystallin A chain-like n=1 Tax=Saccostrea echinata TaxID=191078 RepID=UPI002A808BF2|nr:alpha-crystallin A chain-like [Saccostrea echinata]
MSRLVPVNFHSQNLLVPELKNDFEKCFEEFEKEARREMFKLNPWDMNKDPFDKAHFGKNMLEIDTPFVEDSFGNKKLDMKFDCSQFKPEEIFVKIVDRNLAVHAKHKESSPGKNVQREFTRAYLLPESVDTSKLTSSLSPDGVLTIEAPVAKHVDLAVTSS